MESLWFSHPGFKDLISNNWQSCNNDHLSATLNLANITRKRNNNIFGNLYRDKRRTVARLTGVQKAEAIQFSHKLEDLERTLRGEYLYILNQEETMWQQKSRNKWIVEGDRNTRFFFFFSYYYFIKT